jgi:hypothetical protein
MNNRLLELAIKGLEAERASVDQEIDDLKARTNGGATIAAAESVSAPLKERKRRGLTAAGRKRISDMMKARWALRRKAAKK